MDEDPGGAPLVELVEHPAQPVIIEVLGQHARTNQVLGGGRWGNDPGFTDKELLEQVQRCRNEAESIENEALEYLCASHTLLRMGAQELLNFLNQADRVDDASHDAKVVEILDLDFSGRLAHPTKILQPLYLPAESRL